MNQKESKAVTLRRFVEEGMITFEKGEDIESRYTNEVFIPLLSKFLDDVILEIEERHRMDKSKEGGEKATVIHYTGINNLISMLQDASEGKKPSLRLYDSAYLNDPEEGNYFVRHLRLKQRHAWLGENSSHAYITSFIIPSRDSGQNMSGNDDLVFWRTYGREGEGCSLKLSVPVCRLRKVLYGVRGIEYAEDALLPTLGILSRLVESNAGIQERVAKAVWGSLGRIRYLYKSDAYEYERECRVVMPESGIHDKDRIQFECEEQGTGSARIRHYYEEEYLNVKGMLDSDSLIMLGPCVPYSYNVSYYIDTLLNRAKLLGPEIKTSDIPYRKS